MGQHGSWRGEKRVTNDGQPPACSLPSSSCQSKATASVSLDARRCCVVPRAGIPAPPERGPQNPRIKASVCPPVSRQGRGSSPGTQSRNRPQCQRRQGQAVNRAGWGQTGPWGDRQLRGGGRDAAFLQLCPPTPLSPRTPLPQPLLPLHFPPAILFLTSGVTAARGVGVRLRT